MLPRRKALFIVSLVLMFSAMASFAYADSQARIVRLSYVDGDVQLAHHGSGFENATLNVPIVEGDQLRVGSNGWAEIEFEDGSTIRIAPDSAIVFSELRLLSSGGTATSVDVDQGEAEFKVNKHDEGEFQVTARNKSIVLKHSSRFRVTTLNSNPLEVVVWKGEVEVQDHNAGQEVQVKKKETFAQDLLDPGRYDLEKTAEGDGLDQWSTQRDEYLSTYASKGNYSNSPYQYGVSDLNYYGQYYNVPGYGNMWQPYGVNVGWDPFANGYWNPTPGGYVWVSAYPWGWMPYRFGHWRFVNGYGWLWQPPGAGSWSTWNYCPPVINAPVGFHTPVPPAAGAGVAGGGSKPGTGVVGSGGSKPGVAFLGPPENDSTRPPVKTAGPAGSRTLIQPEPPASLGNGGMIIGSHTGNQGNPGQGNLGTNHTVGLHDNSSGADPHDGHHGTNGIQQHGPPLPPVQGSSPPQPTRMPPTPAPAVHPQVTMNPPPRPQYTPPPAPAVHPAPMPVQSAPPMIRSAPMVHSAPAPAQSSTPGKPR